MYEHLCLLMNIIISWVFVVQSNYNLWVVGIMCFSNFNWGPVKQLIMLTPMHIAPWNNVHVLHYRGHKCIYWIWWPHTYSQVKWIRHDITGPYAKLCYCKCCCDVIIAYNLILDVLNTEHCGKWSEASQSWCMCTKFRKMMLKRSKFKYCGFL